VPQTPFAKAAAKAAAHLSKIDPDLGRVIKATGPVLLVPDEERTPFYALLRAIAHQQLSGRAAETIMGRFHNLFPNVSHPTPDQVLAIEDTILRGVGFSRPKIKYIKDLAGRALSGHVPTHDEILTLGDEELIERLTEIKGIGRWTVQMLLIFKLGRMDVLPIHDLGIQKGFMITYRKRRLPKPETILKYGEKWRPYRTIASWYLWRAVDLAANKDNKWWEQV
jgi:3-methyladenine DNA glycosylase/8-oxoguanine DNA glycosylase